MRLPPRDQGSARISRGDRVFAPSHTAGRHRRLADPPRRLTLVGATLVVAAVSGGIGGAVTVAAVPDVHTASHVSAATAGVVQPASNAQSGSVEQVAAQVLPSVVELRTDEGRDAELGSGVILSSDGLILTNNHVVSTANADAADQSSPRTTVTLADGRTAPFTVVGADPVDDIAVVRAQGFSGLTPISFGSSTNLRVGQQVVAVGSPLGLTGTVTSGIVSALNRAVSPAGDPTSTVLHAIQTDAPLNPGNSGGALVDMTGRLIGLNSAIASAGVADDQSGSVGLGFAVPVDQAKKIADSLIANVPEPRSPRSLPVDNGQTSLATLH